MVFDLEHCAATLRAEAAAYRSNIGQLDAPTDLGQHSFADWVRIVHEALTGGDDDQAFEVRSERVITTAVRFLPEYGVDEFFDAVRCFTTPDELGTLTDLAGGAGLLILVHRDTEATLASLRSLTRVQYQSVMGFSPVFSGRSHASFLRGQLSNEADDARGVKELAALLAEDHLGTYDELIELTRMLTCVRED